MRAIWATVVGPSSTAARTSQRALVWPMGLVSASPAEIMSPPRRMMLIANSPNASPAGVRVTGLPRCDSATGI